ncbi:hypothetical protein FG93_05503 [Bosea sp. LC85]|uniref:hypothetical protein n=1 Tax=Bosea sp. LC85 TaxID=1502851 RepID=UPI0004E32235|nr:hypothetical protein [Bosea sp. LC85]KFC63993.1 hypothetical protein FG93_05503 [Bosea sp. LC85]
MKISAELRSLIDGAVIAGRVTLIAPGATALPPRNPGSTEPVRIHPKLCSAGRQVVRAPVLDHYDRAGG